MRRNFRKGLILNGTELLEPTTVRFSGRIEKAWLCRIQGEHIEIIKERDLARRKNTRPPPLIAARNRIYSGYRYRAQRDNIFFSLTPEEFGVLIKQPCAYCHCDPKGKETVTGLRYNGLDRVVNTRGYVPGNVVPACGLCNSIKSDKLTHKEMKAAMAAVLRVRKKKRG
jgi:hypothetical protein